jgi:hypothetical protein
LGAVDSTQAGIYGVSDASANAAGDKQAGLLKYMGWVLDMPKKKMKKPKVAGSIASIGGGSGGGVGSGTSKL